MTNDDKRSSSRRAVAEGGLAQSTTTRPTMLAFWLDLLRAGFFYLRVSMKKRRLIF